MVNVVIIQTRMTSTRLPGKVMLPLGDKTVLGEVLSRCNKIKGIDLVCCAIPQGLEHDLLIPEIEKYGAKIYRGSESDVLERHYLAAVEFKASTIMRVTSDCPLINVDLCELILSTHFETKAEFTCNNHPASWPHGYDCEVFSFKALESAYLNASLPEEREHVTPWIRKNFKIYNIPNPNGNQYNIRITLDTKDDYINITRIFKNGL
jgi:spore coat polysaccharide biosynthesis protein SpsF